MKIIINAACFFVFLTNARSQNIFFPASFLTDSISLASNIPVLAKMLITKYKNPDNTAYYDNLFRLQAVEKNYQGSIRTLDTLSHMFISDSSEAKGVGFQYRTFNIVSDAYAIDKAKSFNDLYQDMFMQLYRPLSEKARSWADNYFNFDLSSMKQKLELAITAQRESGKDSIGINDAIKLCRSWLSYVVYCKIGRQGKNLLTKIQNEKYIINDSLLVTMPDGGTISLTIVRNRNIIKPQPVVLMYSIYPSYDQSNATEAVKRGYVGIVADTRGKRLSKDIVEPFEHDGKDAFYIIDWISKQPWCNGKIGMYGGSYLGFSQWSAAKYLHPALKTIVPQVAVGAGIDYPMQNGVFMSYMLRWIHYVTNNKYTDDIDFIDTEKWDSLYKLYYTTGRTFRSLDTLEGKPNELFQRWLDHPSYDDYWKQMTPQKEEFAKINIPVLTISGYWDDDQLGAMYYYKQHQIWNKKADDYLLIGPYDHGGSQWQPSRNLLGYTIDSVADISIGDLVFKWLDHILKDSSMPSMLSNKVNYEVMGANEWKHVASLKEMSNDTLTFYLSNERSENYYKLLVSKPPTSGYISQEVDFKDTVANSAKGDVIDAFPALIDTVLHPGKKLVFVSEPMKQNTIFSGSYVASLRVTVNKKDIDLVADLIEQTPDGKYYPLNETVQRASYAKDRSRRRLLHPGQLENIRMNNTFLTSVQLPKGSRLILMIGINNDPGWEINYGTGKDVSYETKKDAVVPLRMKWYNSSTVKIPIYK